MISLMQTGDRGGSLLEKPASSILDMVQLGYLWALSVKRQFSAHKTGYILQRDGGAFSM